MLTGSIPLTGIPMPFISAGGTSFCVFMGAIGILRNVGKSTINNDKTSKTKFDINLFKDNKKKINKI